ncbi:MAG: HDIG domain-containing metalloprotein [Candidatus Microgenomates bacterium]|jgi:putative nucleotidyltransferase with HDIG domain
MTKEKALKLLRLKIQSQNLQRHCYSVGAVMCALAEYFGEDKDLWEVAGLVHDIDYEKYPDTHPLKGLEILRKEGYPTEIIDAVATHAWGYNDKSPKPKNKMEWSLYCCDELTGLIVACTLIRPSKKIADVTVDNILSKWKSKSFAAGVDRSQIEKCEKELGIPLNEFISISLKAMQEIHEDLGL